jgi:exopolysaccharide biosynthesis polyprenyl glycosylphosphotransferase
VISERARLVTILYVIVDLAMTGTSFFAAHSLRRVLGDVADPWLGPIYPFGQYLPLLLIILPLWMLVFQACGLYGRRSAWTLRTEVARLVRATAIGGLLLMAAIFVGRLVYISRPVILLFLLLNGVFVAAGRSLVRALVLDTSTRRHVLVAGGAEEVQRTAATVDAHRDWGIEVVGLVSDGTWTQADVRSPLVLGTFADLPRLVQQRVVDEVIIVPTPGRMDRLQELEPIFLALEEQGIVTRLVVNFLPRSLSEIAFDEFGGMPMLTLSVVPHNETMLVLRRCVDVALAGVLVTILSPVFAVMAIAVKLSSPGPILFRQIRAGLNGRPFTFLKFRSMRIDAESLKPQLAAFNEMDGPVFKMTNDPRVTRVGRLLRRTSLDELPQIWNILKGDMSFVGPRPAVLEEVAQYEPWQRRRLSMKPGLTCLWQVSGRNELSFDEWMRLDLEYIDNWSLWLDLKIALRTIPAVLLGKGAK